MKPDALRLQLRRHQGRCECHRLHKPKVVKRKLVDQDAANAATAITADANAANANANTNAATPAKPDGRGRAGAAPPPAPQLWGHERGRQGAGFQKRCWQGLRLIPIKLVCLNLIRHDTRQQPVPACRPANRANKKLHPVRTRFSNVRTRFSSVRTRFSNVCTFHEMYEASCALNMSSITINIHVCTLYLHVYIIKNEYVNL